MPRTLKLGLSLVSNGSHPAGWRLPEAEAGAAMDLELWKDIARESEKAKIHFIFLADGPAVRKSDEELASDTFAYSGRVDCFEPLTLLSALSVVTSKIGFVTTASTTYNEPFHIARKIASIDHISGGRIGWNVVTSTSYSDAEAKNFGGAANVAHPVRYERAEEFIDVVRKLWDSWEDDAFIRDKESGRYTDPAKMHVPHHVGKHFQVRGPLNIPRPVQGYPVIAQAGLSVAGQEMAARTADLVYTAWLTKETAKEFYDSVKARMEKHGRPRDAALVMPGLFPIVGATMEEARAKLDRLEAQIHPAAGLAKLAETFGDLRSYDLDGPLPDNLPELKTVDGQDLPPSSSLFIHRARVAQLARDKGLTIRQLYHLEYSGGHFVLCGTPEMIADEMEAWFKAGACDGFNVMGPWFPDGLYDFLHQVVPILQARGIFQQDYAGTTLRENLGLERPAHGSAVPRRSEPATA